MQFIRGAKGHLSSVCIAALWIVDSARMPFIFSIKDEVVHNFKACNKPVSESRIRVVVVLPRLSGAAARIVRSIERRLRPDYFAAVFLPAMVYLDYAVTLFVLPLAEDVVTIRGPTN